MVPLLPGTDGIQKMSKSLGNYIGIDEPPNDIYGKTMSLPDDMIVPYIENVTDVPDVELAEIRQTLEAKSANPMELKKRLARELVGQFHSDEEARLAEAHFERTVQAREEPGDIPSYMTNTYVEITASPGPSPHPPSARSSGSPSRGIVGSPCSTSQRRHVPVRP